MVYFLDRPHADGANATLRVRSLPFGGLPKSLRTGTLTLVKQDGDWRIDSFVCT